MKPKTKTKKPAPKSKGRRIDLKPKRKRAAEIPATSSHAFPLNARGSAVGISPSVQRMRDDFAALEAAPAFDGRQALIAGVRPLGSDAQPDDHEPTVMTVRTTKGEVRAWVAAAKRAGHTFPMPWARQVLKLAAAGVSS